MKYDVFIAKVSKEFENLRLSERVMGQTSSKKQALSSLATFGVQQQNQHNISKNPPTC